MIPAATIARVAELYDRYNNALDPVSADCREAKRQFDDVVEALHVTHAPELVISEFRFELVSRCREYLRKNRP
jgi:hypothetical protein